LRLRGEGLNVFLPIQEKATQMWILLLAYFERTLAWIYSKTEHAKQKLREWLGPAPQDYLLLSDGRILPAQIQLPESERSSTFLYETSTHRMTLLQNSAPNGRFRQLPVIACSIEKEGATYDFSDWLAELRANPVPVNPSLKQLAHLYCLVSRVFVPLSGNVTSTSSSGDVELTVWSHSHS